MNSRRTFLSRFPLFAFGAVSASADDAPKSPATLKTIEDVKKHQRASYHYPNGIGFGGEEWKETLFEDRKLLFCLFVLPSFGESYIDVHGWVYREHSQEWQPVLTIKTHNLGKAEWEIDSMKGILSVRGAANNDLNGVEVVRFNLRAT